MSDIKNFDDFLVDSWIEEGCLWKRLEGVIQDFSTSIKSVVAPIAAAVTLGAVVFAAPTVAWGNSATPLDATPPVEKAATTTFTHAMHVPKVGDSSQSPSVKEVAKLSDDLRDVLARLKRGDVSQFAAASLVLAEQAVVSLANVETHPAQVGKLSSKNKLRLV